jgi:riboflavin biosynthesis pyrimidine reductase
MAAGGRDIRIGGGADLIQQYLNAGLVNEFTISIAPVVLGEGKRQGLVHSAPCPSGSGFGRRSVKPSRYATLVRTQHLPRSRSTGCD